MGITVGIIVGIIVGSIDRLQGENKRITSGEQVGTESVILIIVRDFAETHR